MTKPAIPSTSSKQRETQNQPHHTVQSEAGKRPAFGQALTGLLPEVVLMAVAAYLFYASLGFEDAPEPGQLGPGFWPQVLCVGMGICAVVSLVRKLRPGHDKSAVEAVTAGGIEDAGGGQEAVSWPKVGLGTALIAGYALGMVFLGYILATALFFVAFAYLGGQRRWYVAPIGLASSIALAYLFLKVVYVSLPSGVGVFDWFSVVVYELLGIY